MPSDAAADIEHTRTAREAKLVDQKIDLGQGSLREAIVEIALAEMVADRRIERAIEVARKMAFIAGHKCQSESAAIDFSTTVIRLDRQHIGKSRGRGGCGFFDASDRSRILNTGAQQAGMVIYATAQALYVCGVRLAARVQSRGRDETETKRGYGMEGVHSSITNAQNEPKLAQASSSAGGHGRYASGFAKRMQRTARREDLRRCQTPRSARYKTNPPQRRYAKCKTNPPR